MTGPLAGRRVLVTRAREQAPALAERLRALGAEVVEAPAIRIEPLDQRPLRAAVARLAEYRWLVVTSPNAAGFLLEAMRAEGIGPRALANVQVAAVGPATSEALAEGGVRADVIAERFVAEGVLDAMRARGDAAGSRALLPAAAGARDVLAEGLRETGMAVDVVPVYRSVPDEEGRAAMQRCLADGAVDAVTLTSGSTVRGFVEAVGPERARGVRAVVMGPVTRDAARQAGLNVAAEAREATIPALADAVVELLR